MWLLRPEDNQPNPCVIQVTTASRRRGRSFYDRLSSFDYQTQHAVSRRVLGPEIEGEIAQGGFGHNGLASAAGSTPAVDAGSPPRALAAQAAQSRKYVTE